MSKPVQLNNFNYSENSKEPKLLENDKFLTFKNSCFNSNSYISNTNNQKESTKQLFKIKDLNTPKKRKII